MDGWPEVPTGQDIITCGLMLLALTIACDWM